MSPQKKHDKRLPQKLKKGWGKTKPNSLLLSDEVAWHFRVMARMTDMSQNELLQELLLLHGLSDDMILEGMGRLRDEPKKKAGPKKKTTKARTKKK